MTVVPTAPVQFAESGTETSTSATVPPASDVVRVATPAEFVIAVPSGVSSSKFPFAFASRTNVTVWPALQAPETVAWRPTDVLGKYPVPVKRIPSGAGVMSVGRIAVRKGLDDVVALGARRPELVIDVVGSHSLWSDYRGLFASTSDNVRLLGHRPREAIYELLEAATDRCQDVANVIDFFASPESNFITGQIIPVEGGLLQHQ